ncbi:hypothetical protein Tco_0749811 [Tanacetum coccineum]|uniref:Uncharacterized protein n=1 Tax=Tanacetum coccineum TaxID=301880 RepID=A0ABQ4Z0I9_9ASTR
MKDSSTDPLEDNPKIQAFRRELEEYCIKAFWDSPGKTTLTVLLSVKYWRNLKRLLKLYSHARRTVTAQATTSMGSCRSTSWNEGDWHQVGKESQDDPLDSLVHGLVTPSTTKVNVSGEEQVEDISPNTLEAAKTLSRVASLEPNTVSEQLSTGNEQVSTVGAKKSTSSHDKGQREGKAPMISEETPKKSKEQILQEEASLLKQFRLDSFYRKEEEAKQITWIHA